MTADQPHPPIHTGDPAHDAVYAYIRTLPPDDTERNAHIWRGVHAALAAARTELAIQKGITADLRTESEARGRKLAALESCGASMAGVGAEPIGPCVLRAGHDGPMHQAADGARWWLSTEPDPHAVVQSVTREQLHDAIRTLARTDPKWWNDTLRRYVRINHNGRLP